MFNNGSCVISYFEFNETQNNLEINSLQQFKISHVTETEDS